jgi:hypothetical protein
LRRTKSGRHSEGSLLRIEGIAYLTIAFALFVPVVMLVIYIWTIFP